MKLRRGRRSHETQREWVYEQLKHMLMSGTFAPGQKLTLARIAADLGVSMMPVREALRRLDAERALTMRPNRSVTVPRLSRGDAVDPRDPADARRPRRGDRREPDHQAEVARLAVLQAELAAARGRGDPKRILALNEEFHFPSTTPRASRCSSTSLDALAAFRADARLLLPQRARAARVLRDAVRNNLALVASLKHRDPEGARHAIEAEIVEGSPLLDRLMREGKWDETAVAPRPRRTRSASRKLP